MQRGYLYLVLFGVPALILAAFCAAGITAAGAGMLWLFVFGDNPWSRWGEVLLAATAVVAFCVVWAALLTVAYSVGRHQDPRAPLNRWHVSVAVASTLILVGAIALRVSGARSRASRTDEEVCANYCRTQGFSASGTPPRNSGDRTCSCYDGQGHETRRTPIASIPAGAR